MENKILAVPVMLGTLINGKKEELLARLKELNATEVIISFFDNGYNPFENLDDSLEKVKFFDAFFREKGYEASVWISTLDLFYSPEFAFLTNTEGNKICTWNCPLDQNFVSKYCEFVKKIAKIGIRKIVLEDDFRMQFPSNKPSCFCEHHLKFYSEILGRAVTREEMKQGLEQGPNEYRSAWFEGNRVALESCAKKIRQAIDEVDETIEVRLCCGPSLFGGDGSDPFKLAEIFAGKTGHKEVRLIGAPYWAKTFKMNLSVALDFARHQAFECKKRGILSVAEGDAYPRPRHAVPAAELEFYHTVTIADGNFDGIMKYAVDYGSDFDYEIGYAKQAEKNKQLYKDIERIFENKKCVGVYLHEPFDRVEREGRIANTPESYIIHSAARKFTSDLSLPVCFETGGVNIIFGENALGFDKALLKNGAVLDIKAAQILQEQGVDVGIKSVEKVIPGRTGHGLNYYKEYYHEYNDTVALYRMLTACHKLTLDEKAKELTQLTFCDVDCVGAYLYENADGQRFLVYNFDIAEAIDVPGLIRSYYRQRQFVDAYEWLNGKKLDAMMLGNPDLYILTKRGEASLAIGIWNHFADETVHKIIQLDKVYKRAEFVNCRGELNGDKITLTSPIPAYGFGFIEVFDR